MEISLEDHSGRVWIKPRQDLMKESDGSPKSLVTMGIEIELFLSIENNFEIGLIQEMTAFHVKSTHSSRFSRPKCNDVAKYP